MIQTADMRLESGTCNVCSAPCSSCTYLNHSLMGSKAEEFSDENCRLGEANNHYSMDQSNLSSLRSKASENLQHAVSETSNILSVNSSQDSLSENAQSKQVLSDKYQGSKYLEGHDDNISSISRASDSNLENISHQRNAERINACSSASVSHVGAEGSVGTPSVDMSGLSEIPFSKDADSGHSTSKVQSMNRQSQSGKSLSNSARLIHPEGNSLSRIPEKLLESPNENPNSSLNKEAASTVVSGEKSIASNDSPNDSIAKVSSEVCPKSEAGTDDIGDAKDESCKGSVRDGQHEKTEELVKSPFKQELQSEDESDELDAVEHDVKVCDICGDAGREDLLAICSRCSDGAEHTYCMREMLQKVPEGEWLCEECKYAEETRNQGLEAEEKMILKGSLTSQVSNKRLLENIEVASAAKRQALESSTGSPKASSPKRLVPLSRESSFKNLDKGKVKPGHLMPIHNHSSGDDTEVARSPSIGPRSQIPKSTLSKCSSFNNLSSKPRVKIVDDVVPQKPKGAGDQSSKNMEMPARMTGKSTLFKSSSLGRSSTTAPKVKMLSPKSATVQEPKGLKHMKESGAFDRKFPSRTDRPVVSSSIASSVVSTAKGDQKLTSRGETTKPSAVCNNRELKVNQDGKSNTSYKLVSNVSQKTLEPQVCSEKTSTHIDEAVQDVLPRPRETANQVEKTRGGIDDRVRPGFSNASKNPICQKCKEYGHVLEFCTAGNTQESGAEVSFSASSSSIEDMHKGNKLKAAIQAALLRRPEIYKKKETPNQTDGVSPSGTNLNGEVILQDQPIVSSLPKNIVSAVETREQQEILESSTSDSIKCLSDDDLKQPKVSPTGFCSQPVKSDSVGLAAGKPVVRDLSNKALAIPIAISKMLVIPEYEYIWQGVFEVHRNGKPPNFCAGVQAHLSSCASPKVRQEVNKFLPKVTLNEVPRLSTWPSQFRQVGTREDHIALYFFAKDIESYERHYKGLVDHMIRSDLALKGTFDGVELLIFPSSQLPENSQRWNMLFFLWGVFRGRRISHSDSTEKNCIPSLNAVPVEEDSTTAVVTKSETHCSQKYTDEKTIACDEVCAARPPSGYIDQPRITASMINDNNDQTHLGLQVKLEKQDSGVDIKSTSVVPIDSKFLCHEMKSTGSSLKPNGLEHGQCRESKPPEAIGTSVNTRTVETKTGFDISVKQEKALLTEIPSVGKQERGTPSSVVNHKMSERVNSDEDQQNPSMKQKADDHYIDLEATTSCDQGKGAESHSIKQKISGRINSDEEGQQRPKRKPKGVYFIDLEATVGDQETETASNDSKDRISERINGDEDQQRPKTKQKDYHYIDLEAPVDNHDQDSANSICKDEVLGRMDGEGKQWPKKKQKDYHYIDLEANNEEEVQYVDLSDTVMQAPVVSCQKRSWDEVVNGKLEDGGSSSKKLKAGFGGIYGGSSSEGRDSLEIGSSSSVEGKGCKEACEEKIIPEDVGSIERTFFPVDNSRMVLSSTLLKGPHEYRDRFHDAIPNLELGLRGETIPPPPPPPQRMLPFLVGAVDRKNSPEIRPDGLVNEQEDDDGDAASLSLSLSFPTSNKDPKIPATKAAEVLPDEHRVNSSFLLFGRYTDK
ncbi:uncharacterized protein LOC130982145 [Arachis stenosperma]|uniref:uncharacterized protein LOC130982145 n=1 Tax=Arachis stenosperma TaxID=217475 RepID=UPI0025AC3AB5|nr:uncharacterized protein LOC130982145 [Arachis stenosperma]XP_057762000.1 uncharacterized protein LOC130982145 [Arachis stenosperma]